MNEALHPIVIQAIKCGPFECLGDGLLHDGVGREQPHILTAVLDPMKTLGLPPIENRERPKKWWKAQCLHYGIHVSSSAPIRTYRTQLENAICQRGGLKRPQNLADLEFEQNTKFRLLNAQVRDATTGGSQAKSSGSKTKATGSTQVPVTESLPAGTKQRATAESKAKSAPKPKAESKQKAKELKAKPEAKTKTETKAKAKTEPSATTDTAPKATARKRKVETVVHVYHYDGDKATSASLTPNTEAGVVPRPTKKARTAASSASTNASAHSSNPPPPSYSQVAPRPKQISHKGSFSLMNGTYEVTCGPEGKWRSPSGCRPTLSIEISERRDSWVTGVLEVPGHMVCALRLKPGLPCPDDGYVRFEWCGHDEVEGQMIPPNEYYVGWLKLNEEAQQVKGMIEGLCAEFTFSGHRIGPVPRMFPAYNWDEFGMDADYEDPDAW